VWPGHSLAEIPDLSSLTVHSQVNEALINRITDNMPVRITADAIGGMEFEGKITSIGRIAIDRAVSPAGELATNEQQEIMQKVFEITVTPENLDNRVRPGMTARISIITDEIPDAVSVPLSCVFTRNAKSIVYRVAGKKYEKIDVTLGMRNTKRVIILEGLKPGDKILGIDPESEKS
jgi:HlyD family secretion protein